MGHKARPEATGGVGARHGCAGRPRAAEDGQRLRRRRTVHVAELVVREWARLNAVTPVQQPAMGEG